MDKGCIFATCLVTFDIPINLQIFENNEQGIFELSSITEVLAIP
jgi:hypothetical protein